MKTLLIFLIALFASVSFVNAQAVSGTKPVQSAEETQLAGLNREMLQAYRDGRYDEALKLGEQALSLSSRLSGGEGKPAASALFNLGAVYRAKKMYVQAADNFQRSLTIYQKNIPEDPVKTLALYNQMGLLFYEQQDNKSAETWFLKALELSEKLNGVENKDTLAYALSLAMIYRDLKDYEQAEAYLYRVKNDSVKIFGPQSPEVEQYSDNYSCYTISEAGDKLEKILAKRQEEQKKSLRPGNAVINGYATSLAKPAYPKGAGRDGGKVVVKVRIDEKGKVVGATAFCGPAIFRPGSENAARNSLFAPTMLKGVAVKVSGLIVYNFEPSPLKSNLFP